MRSSTMSVAQIEVDRIVVHVAVPEPSWRHAKCKRCSAGTWSSNLVHVVVRTEYDKYYEFVQYKDMRAIFGDYL